MELIKRFSAPRTDRYNNQKHHWPRGSITVFSIACCVYGGVRIGYALETLAGFNPGPELCALAILVVLFQRFSSDAHVDAPAYRVGVDISGVCVGLLLYGTPLLLLSDLAYALLRGRTAAEPAIFRAWLILAAALLAIAITAGGLVHAAYPKVKTYRAVLRQKETREADTPARKDNSASTESHYATRLYRIVQLSDMHIGAIVGSRFVRRVCEQVKELQPDMVVLTGDIFNHGYVDECRDIAAIEAAFAELNAPDGTWSVLGNHDPAPNDPELLTFYQNARITPVDNDTAALKRLNLVGRTGVAADVEKRVRLQDLLAKADPNLPIVVLDHDPTGIPEAAACGADLVLAGHTHQGQFFPYNLFVALGFPKGCFHGLHREGSTISIVSAGTGIFQVPLRVGTDSEIVCVDLDLK